MIKQVVHEVTGPIGPAGITLALAVAHELHVPAPRKPQACELRTVVARTPEVAVPQLMGLRTGPRRTHRRKVPLNRLTAVLG